MATPFELRFPKVLGIPSKEPTRRRGIRREIDEYSIADYLADGSAGDTELEKVAFGAMKEVGISIDETQKWIYLIGSGDFTRVDFYIESTRTAIYIDGIQHEIRPEIQAKDQEQDRQLKQMGYRVVRISWRDLLNDPRSAVLQILYAGL